MVIGYPAQIYGYLSGSRFPGQHEQGLHELVASVNGLAINLIRTQCPQRLPSAAIVFNTMLVLR